MKKDWLALQFPASAGKLNILFFISAPLAAMRVGCFFERLCHPLALSGERDNQDNPESGME